MYGVEMFVNRNDDQIFLNEVAPRHQNTRHYTKEACVCIQLENHFCGYVDYITGEYRLDGSCCSRCGECIGS